MATTPKIVRRDDDDIDSSEDEAETRRNNAKEKNDSSDIGDPWQEMKIEDELKEEQERESRRKTAQNELLGIDSKDLQKWDDETGLVVPIKQLVQFAGRGCDIKERRQSAFGFAHFSTEETSQQQITDFDNDYGIDALLSLLESDDNICRRYSSLALGNIVSNKRFAGKCIEFGVLEAMLPLAIDEETDLETRRYCMLAVANMAAEPITYPTILKSLQHIIILIDSFDEEIQKCATLCIQNLSSSREIVLQLQDAIQPLVNLLSITKGKHIPLPDAKLHCVAALRGLCIADVLRLTIINEGVLRAFLQIIDNPANNAILVEIAAILCGFSSLYETHVDLLQPAVLHSIFLLAMGDIVEAQQFGSTTLANLASNSANHEKLIDANAICNLLIMCDYVDHRVISAATRALTNFASNTKRHQTLLDEGCLPVMIRILSNSASNSSNECNMFCALFFSILSANNSLHNILCIADIIQPLFHLIVMNHDHINIETIRYSVLALANLAHCGQSQPFILSEIEIQMNSFFSLALFDKDIETQRYFGLLLSNLAENVNAHQLLSTLVALTKTITLLHSSNIEVVLNCLSFILKLLCNKKQDTIRIRISHMFSEIICNLSTKHKEIDNEELLFMIAAYFSNITTSAQVRKELVWDEIVHLMGDMLSSDSHKDIQIHAMNALANLRDVNDAVNIMVESEILSLIIKCVQSPIMDIHSSALRLMSGISSHEIAIHKLIDLKCIQFIGPFVRSPHSAFRKYAYICLANYASHISTEVTTSIDLNDVNLIKCFLNLSIDEKVDSEEMRCCLFALANIAYHKENKEIIAESGIIINKTLIDYVGDVQDSVMNEYASLLLSNCSVILATHSMFGYHDVIQMIINLCNTTHGNECTVINAMKCLRNLAFHDQHIHILLECKITDFIVQFVTQRKEKESAHKYSPFIDRELSGLVYNLASHPSSIQYIARNDLILSVTALLISNESDTRRDAARALSSISMHTDIATPLFLQNKQCLDYILSSLKFNNDLDLYHSLAIILGYIFSLEQVQKGTSYKVTRTHILSLLRKSQSRQIQLAALWATSTGSDAVIMCDDEMLQIIASLAEPQLPQSVENDDDAAAADEEQQKLFGESPLLLKTIRRRALITLVNYSKNEENQRLIIKNCSNVIRNAFNLNNCNDIDVILLSAMLLSNLSQSLNPEIHEEMIANHDISTLDLYLGYNHDNIQIFAARTLSAVCNTPKYAKALILSEKIIPLMCLTTLRNHLLLNQEIASFFQNLSRHEKFIAMVLEQHLMPTLIELLKTNTDITIRNRVIAAVQNCCCASCGSQTLQRMIEVQNGVPFLWNLLLKFGANHQSEQGFISCVIKILSLFTQREDCKQQLLTGLYHKLNFDDTLSMINDDESQTEQKKEDTSAISLSDEYAQSLCKLRLKSLLNVIFYAKMDEKLCGAKILKELSALTELHSIWMDEDLQQKEKDSRWNSLSYLTLYSLFSMIKKQSNDELIELSLTVISQLLLYPATVSKLLQFNEMQDEFNIIHQLQIYGNHSWKSIRTLSFNISAYLMEFVQKTIASNNDQYSDYLKQFYLNPSKSISSTRDTQQRLNGISLIQINAKIPDIRLQAQSARLLSVFSCIKECIEQLNNDDMYALLFLLAEQAWRIGGDTEVKPTTENRKDDIFLSTQSKDVHIIHLSVVTILSNMVISLKGEFIPESTNLIAAILRYVKDRNVEIRSLAFICVSGKGKRDISPLFHIWEDPLSMMMDALQNTPNEVIAVNVQCNIMKAFILLSENVNHLKYIMHCNDDNNTRSIFKLIIQFAQADDSYTRYLALIALKNIIALCCTQKLELPFDESLIEMIRYLFTINTNQIKMQSIQNYVTQNRYHRQQKVEELYLMIVSYLAKLNTYQDKLLLGDDPNVVQSIVDDMIMSDATPPYHNFLCTLTLYHLSQNKECMQCLINIKGIESALYITLTYMEATNFSLKHLYVSLSCIANLCTLNDCRVIKGREVHLQSEHQQIIHHQQEIQSFPLFALETLHEICVALQMNTNQNKEVTSQYSVNAVHKLVALIASRVTSHLEFELNNMDLCYLNTIIYYFSSTDFFIQSYALITFANFLCKSTQTMFKKIICSKSWIPILLCLVDSTNMSVKNLSLKCILKIIDNEQESENSTNQTLRDKLQSKPQLLRFLDDLFCDSHFPQLLQLSLNNTTTDNVCNANEFTLTAISRILLILCQNMPMNTLLIHRADSNRNELLCALIEFTLNPHKDIKINGAAALSCFLSHSLSDANFSSNIAQRILGSAKDGIERGLIAFYEMITNKEICTFCSNERNQYLNAKHVQYAKTIGAIVIAAISSLSNRIEFTKKLVNTQNGLGIITSEVLNGIAQPNNEFVAFQAAQILRNVCREKENIKIFLRENGCECLLKLIASESVELKFLAAGTLSDIINHATSNEKYEDDDQTERLFVLTTEHLSPYMSTITDCLLQLLQNNIPSNNNMNRKLLRMCLALLHKLCKDSDNCKKLMVESGAIKPLCSKWFESIKNKYPASESDLILNLLQCLATFSETQIEFIQENGDKVLNYLVNCNAANSSNSKSSNTSSINANHHHAAVIISSLIKNKETHALIATYKIYSLLLTLRHSPHNESRKLAMETLLNFLENKRIHSLVKHDVDLGQTLAAIAKFGASKQIKQRSSKIIKIMLGKQAYLDIIDKDHQRDNSKNKKNKNKNIAKNIKPIKPKNNENEEKKMVQQTKEVEIAVVHNANKCAGNEANVVNNATAVDFWHDDDENNAMSS